jgi:hypothetical protein
MLSGTAFSDPTYIDLNAKLYPTSIGPGGPLGHYRTYYKPGDHVMLMAIHTPGYLWGISWGNSFKDAKYVFTIKNNNIKDRINDPAPFEWSEPLHSSNSGRGMGFYIPSTAKPGDSYTLTVTLSVSGINIVPTSSTLPSTIIRVTDEISTDLWIPFLGEYDQGHWEWGKDQLGTCYEKYPTIPTTMKSFGCATTAKAFLFSYLDINYINNYRPGTLNNCLTLQDGYDAGCLIPKELPKAEVCKPYDVLWEGYYQKNIDGVKLTNILNTINDYLESGYPVIVKAMQKYDPDKLHYYVVIGKRGSDKWNVFDPLDGQIYRMEDTRLNLKNDKIRGIYLYSQW